MSREKIRRDAGGLRRPGSVVRCVDNGETVVVILEPYEIPAPALYVPGQAAALAFIVPAPYPDASPDATGFYLKPHDLTVATTKAAPQSTAKAPFLGETWLKFSWGPKGPPWDPETDTLETYLATLEKRFFRQN